MENRICVLPDGVANQIAAGEVVNRPASVVKELLENAVDAGSTSVTLHFKDGGRELIQVVDNGCGMSEPDARLAFERHATSKIRKAEDLYHLSSFGFRGEALPSIASVAEVELRTRTAGSELGTQISINGGAFVAQTPVQTSAGTQFLIKNLFYNTPGRRRFLKEGRVEARYIVTEFQRVALCNPDVAFTVYNNDSLVFSLPAGNLRQRIVGVHGRNMAGNLLDVSADTSIVKIEGFVGRPGAAKKNNKEQYLFVNGRYFNSPYFRKAVLQAYEKLIAPDTQPSYFLYLTIDPERIDVNVHPSKTEIKFDDEPAVWQIFNAAVREALGKAGAVPMMDFEMDSTIDIPVYKEGVTYKVPEVGINPDFNPFRDDPERKKTASGGAGKSAPVKGWEQLYDSEVFGYGDRRSALPNEDLDEVDSENIAAAGDQFEEIDSGVQDFISGDDLPEQGRLDISAEGAFGGLLRLSDRLWATVLDGALAVVDMRRAQERVLYERYLRMLGNDTAVSQQLLFPETVELSPEDAAAFTDIAGDLSAIGFEFSHAGGTTVEITGIPPELSVGQIADVLQDIVGEVGHIESAVGRRRIERIAGVLARKGAAAVRPDEVSAAALLEELSGCGSPGYTPSGRPVMTLFTETELEKRLKNK